MLSDIMSLMIGFAKAGLFGYGGGAGVVGMLRTIAVNTHGWLTDQEFSDVVTVSYSLPGPVATQLAGVIGWKVAGFFGSVVAIISVILPSLFAMFLIVYLIRANSENPIVHGIINGVRPVVFAILAILALEFAGHAKASWLTASIGAVSFILLYYFKINPAYCVVGAMLIGGFFLKG